MEKKDEREEYTYEDEEREELTEERILQMLDERKFKELKEALEHRYPVDLAELMEQVGGLLPPNVPRQRDAPEQSGMTMK